MSRRPSDQTMHRARASSTMLESSSESWRAEGDAAAFDSDEWEFKSRQFVGSARFLLQSFDEHPSAPTFDTIMLLPTAEFLLALALELMSKVYYLRAKSGPQQAIYRHEVVGLYPEGFFSDRQVRLMHHAERYVVWAGRYPTPKWTKEHHREEYDVHSTFSGGVEHIHADDIPNTASRPRCGELIGLYEHVHRAWATLAA